MKHMIEPNLEANTYLYLFKRYKNQIFPQKNHQRESISLRLKNHIKMLCDGKHPFTFSNLT